MTNKKVDIKDFLQHIDDFDLNYIEDLSEEEKKSISPYLLMLWMSNCKSEIQLLQINSLINSLVFNIPNSHKDLLFKLALIASDGKRKQYKWFNKSGKSKKYSTCIKIIQKEYKCSSATALEYIPLLDYNDILEIAIAHGEQEDTLKKIKQELK